ncbi:ABC transporter ATP-binding protein [Deefgea sp. CFH1-16]|uniref:ABC transporter ATP-binding protein n=1 Tax=Deefgea sp. CFH1-16 TaxID=2675457 RepID=UPI0015F57C94|nr:ABC transporter ATP-binding protein [Deefgea sp. CFH1-16]MBM5574803.1 ATP-binding cassette domain-containing protein [Deefgea sp. CFH1-16]
MHIAVEFQQVSRHFGGVRAVDEVSVQIMDGEFFSMLGPSGSGKTTCLRLIAGFEQASAGAIFIHGVSAQGLPPYRRDVNTVFQDYALFPHMNILDNVAYGLKVKGIGQAERYRQAEAALDMVALGGFGARKPGQMSGGQRQRVALARALVNQPRVLLLDEPLGALDLKLREQMQSELKALQKQLGITFIYVTHDQGEALSMSDRVAVFNQGKIEQIDTPKMLYSQPKTVFVADFVGTANVIRGALAEQITGTTQPFAVRPEQIRLGASTSEPQLIGQVADIHYLGASSRLALQVSSGERVWVTLANDSAVIPEIGSALTVHWPKHSMVLLNEAAS